jgi:3-hydroxyisobutyrate dehydrogenase-like beta-hydroxyacid dehydrogenase
VKVGFIGAGRMGRPMVTRLVEAGHDVRALNRIADKRRDLEQLGATAVTVLGALTHGSATSRALDIVAATGSVASFIEVAGEFVGKDVAVVRGIAADLGSNLGALDDVIEVLNAAERSDLSALRFFPVRHESATVNVTVRHSSVMVPARPDPRR